jgi:hypothetical protein
MTTVKTRGNLTTANVVAALISIVKEGHATCRTAQRPDKSLGSNNDLILHLRDAWRRPRNALGFFPLGPGAD